MGANLLVAPLKVILYGAIEIAEPGRQAVAAGIDGLRSGEPIPGASSS